MKLTLGAVIEKGISEKVIFKLGPSVRKEPASERRIGMRLGCLGNGKMPIVAGAEGWRGGKYAQEVGSGDLADSQGALKGFEFHCEFQESHWRVL